MPVTALREPVCLICRESGVGATSFQDVRITKRPHELRLAISSEAEALISDFGGDAYAEACRRAGEASLMILLAGLERCRGDDRSQVGNALIPARRFIRLKQADPDPRHGAAGPREASLRTPCAPGAFQSPYREAGFRQAPLGSAGIFPSSISTQHTLKKPPIYRPGRSLSRHRQQSVPQPTASPFNGDYIDRRVSANKSIGSIAMSSRLCTSIVCDLGDIRG